MAQKIMAKSQNLGRDGNAERAPLPTLFIPHGGGPCFFMEWTMGPPDTWNKMADFLKGVDGSIGRRPKAVLVVSGHWEEPNFSVGSGERPALIYDYSGFPPHTYELKYPATGSPELAGRVQKLLSSAALPAAADPKRGWDHGVFVPFKLIYPDADVPIVQLSLRSGLDPAAHLAVGRALAPLRNEGVLIVGSGMSFHNLRGFRPGAVVEASDQFDPWLTDSVTDPDQASRDRKLVQWSNAPAARQAHPREEHLIPLMVAAGAAGADRGRKTFSDRVMGATVSAFQFGG
jgi:aromatic ring-opening dioxygenase catalytic subunit (LigB family)